MLRALAAWSVHFYTALGAVFGLLALHDTARGRYGMAFFWMAVATFVDSTDGILARAARVKTVVPQFDGTTLDNIVDYLDYVIVPLFLALQAPGFLPEGDAGLWAASLSALASCYGFCRTDAKTPDHFFTGFPSYWNVLVFYLYVLGTPGWLNAAVLVFFAVLVFVPIRYMYPSRNPVARVRMWSLGALWGAMMFCLMYQFPAPSRLLAVASLFFPAYYVGVSLKLHAERRQLLTRGREAEPG